MATKTKEEHLRQLEQEDRDFASKIREEQWIQHREMRASALAERDAAREELAQARNRIEFLENGAAPVDAAQPAEDVAPKLREALALSLGVDPSRPIWALVNEAIGRIRFLEVAAHPVAAPVVGGVTEAMLDEIGFHAMATNQLGEAIDRARAAIRAQKRVDVEAIREVARDIAAMSYASMAKELLRAIGAEPAAPAQEQEGPFTDNGGFGWINDNGVAQLKAINEEAAKRYTRLLDAGLEAPKLRARVAELAYHISHDGQSYQAEKARADAAEAKLAALGENPIPRALGERWHSYASGLQSGAWFAELLAGREPGAAS